LPTDHKPVSGAILLSADSGEAQGPPEMGSPAPLYSRRAFRGPRSGSETGRAPYKAWKWLRRSNGTGPWVNE
jgi:hypothetical protein